MKKFDYKTGLIINLVLSSLITSAKIVIVNSKDYSILVSHFIYLFVFIFIYWYSCQYVVFEKKNKPLKIGLYFIFSGVFSIIYHIILQFYFKDIFLIFNNLPIVNTLNFQQQIIIIFIRGVVFAFFIYFILYYINLLFEKQKSLAEIELLKKEKLEVQLFSLQQQISPHFLFNSLSTLKNIVEDNNSKKYIIQLSNVYRYLLNFNEDHLVTLSEELEFIKSYLYIQKERFEDALEIEINIEDQALQRRIPPLSLQLLIENAIKHNIVSLEDPLHIIISTKEQKSIIVSNNLQLKFSSENSSRIGLKNIETRYDLLSNKTISIKNNNNKFEVELPLLD